MSASARGRRNRRTGQGREREWMKRLLREGWEVAFRPAYCVKEGCDHVTCLKQPFDILACKGGEIVVDEVKSTKTPFATFGPARREAVREAARRAGGRPRLVWWPTDRKGVRIIEEGDWPE